MEKPDARGYFGAFGGKFVPEVLVQALAELEAGMDAAFADPAFWNEYHAILRDFVGRPSPLMEATRFVDGDAAKLLFKREDLNHTGAHKINNTVGQGLLARRMGKKRIIAETGAGQHGVATATIGAKLGIPVDVFMGALDVERQALNVYVMKLLGATVHSVTGGTQTLKDATNEAFREWAARVEDTFYIIGSVVGAHPYPYMVRELQKVIGIEARAQTLERYGRLPTDVVACVGGGSNAMGIFAGFAAGRERAVVGRRSRGPWFAIERYGRFAERRERRHPARIAFVSLTDGRRPSARYAFDFGRPRLPGRRARTRAPQRYRACDLRFGNRRRRARRFFTAARNVKESCPLSNRRTRFRLPPNSHANAVRPDSCS